MTEVYENLENIFIVFPGLRTYLFYTKLLVDSLSSVFHVSANSFEVSVLTFPPILKLSASLFFSTFLKPLVIQTHFSKGEGY